MLLTNVPFWKEAPFIRLLLPFAISILLQWYAPLRLDFIFVGLAGIFCIYLLSLFLKGVFLYLLKWISGVCIMLMVTALGMFLTHFQNIRHWDGWFGNYYSDSAKLMVVLREPPIEKAKSYKVEAAVITVMDTANSYATKGKRILYFKKGSALARQLQSGMVLIVNKTVQPITNSGNPGAFEYKRYCLFQGITHQAFLGANDFAITELR